MGVTLDVVEDEVRPRVTRVGLTGELDLSTAYAFDRRLLAIEQGRPALIVIDLRGLTMLDSAGLGRIVSAQRRARRGGWRLVLVRGGRAIQRVLQTTRLNEHLDIVRDMSGVLGDPAGGRPEDGRSRGDGC